MPLNTPDQSELLVCVPTLSVLEFEQAISGIREIVAFHLNQKSGLDVTTLLTNAYFPIAQAVVLDDDSGRRREKGERLSRIIRQDIYRIIGEHPLDNTFRNLLLRFLRRISPETLADPTPLPYRILPPGEGYVPEEIGLGNEKNEHHLDYPRVDWALDIAKTIDAAFHQSQHFFVSQLDADVQQEPYHAILFPAFGRCVFVCNSYSNATYIVPMEEWEDWARNHKIVDLRQAADAYQQDPSNSPVTWFPMQADEGAWRVRLVSEIGPLTPVASARERTSIEKRSFEEWLQLITEFYVRHQRWPSQVSENKEEINLYSKIMTLRQAYRNEKLVQENKRDQVLSGHRLSKEQEQRLLDAGIVLDTEGEKENEFQRNLQDCITFFHRQGYWPKKSSEDEKEKDLAKKIHYWREGYRNEQTIKNGEVPKSGARLPEKLARQILNAGIILDTQAESKRQNEISLQNCVLFFQKHGHWPRPSSADAVEKNLANRIQYWRNGYRNMQLINAGEKPVSEMRLSEEDTQQILAAGITLDTEYEFNQQFQTDLQQCVAHKEKTGRWPNSKSLDPNVRRLAVRMTYWRVGFRNEHLLQLGQKPKGQERLSEYHKQQIRAVGIILDTDTNSEEKFQECLIACVTFQQRHKRWPSLRTTDKEERKLAIKISMWRIGMRNEQLLQQGIKPKTGHRLSQEHAQQLIEAGIITTTPKE